METRTASLERVIHSSPSTENFYPDFCRFLQRQYPLLQKYQGLVPSQVLCSPHILHLPLAILPKVSAVVSAFHELRGSPIYRERISTESTELISFDPGNESVLMGYDFHIDQSGEPKLIEINTNAAFSLLAQAMRDFQGLPQFGGEPFLVRLKRSFERELRLCIGETRPEGIAIMDESPERQKLFVEFIMFCDLFESWGWSCAILNPGEMHFNSGNLKGPDGQLINLVYNRDTDFLISASDRRAVREAYFDKKICLTPNPHEYLLLADKTRLAEVGSGGGRDLLPIDLASALDRFVPKCLDLTLVNYHESIWWQRRSLFFKPKRLFGSKAAYRGSSISKKVFEQAVPEGFIAQEFVPAPEVAIMVADSPQFFKYDLRFYVYRNEIQLAVARLYQGQVTNSQTLGGGFASVIFE